jgi:hypothetical protein
LLAFTAEHETAADPIEKFEAQLAFQVGDLSRERRLSDAQTQRRL